jgi:hypothetical protein
MRLKRRFQVLTLLVYAASVLAYSQSVADHGPPQYGQPPDDLGNALVQMARTSRTPLVAELVWPLPKIHAAEGVGLTPDSLSELVRQAPEYQWEIRGKVVHFYSYLLRHAPLNFMNLRFQEYQVPETLSELKLWFPGQATGLLEGYSGTGGMTTGFGDTLLAKERLAPATLRDTTPLDVLIYVANEEPTFYAVLVFPQSTPTKKEAEDEVVWRWGSLYERLSHSTCSHPLDRRRASIEVPALCENLEKRAFYAGF